MIGPVAGYQICSGCNAIAFTRDFWVCTTSEDGLTWTWFSACCNEPSKQSFWSVIR